MRSIVTTLFIVAAAFCLISAAPSENRGAPEIMIDAAKKGEVSFPHKRHQDALTDCNKCHTLFPKEKGSIRKGITEGRLDKKQVMTYCRNCHKEMADAGEKTGPTSCSKCHPKE